VSDALLEVEGLSVEFATAQGWARVVDDVSFTIGRGETLGLLGESGCGKSVTSLAVMGLLPPRSSRVATGSVRLNGRELIGLSEAELSAVRGENVSMVFQEPMTSLDPAFRVGEQIGSVLRRHRGLSRAAAKRRAVELLDLVGIPEAARRVDDYPHTFSGGMRQRVVIAIALACDPDLLIADEPTTALDVTVQAQILELMGKLQEDLGMGILFVTHDMGVVSQVSSRVVVMYAGQVVEESLTSELFNRPQHPYTEGLLACLPAEHGRERLRGIRGMVPGPLELPGGCRFHPRCEYAQAGRCDVQPPPLEDVLGTHSARCLRVHELELRGVR
jgi:oligopeptide/dipeptide ABC transporter ATP-binding protein